jgi:hypothetical protein
MNIFTCAIIALMINTVVGASVWTLIDNTEKDLYKWYSEVPVWPYLVKPVILNLWPVAVFMFIQGYYDAKKNS